MDLYVYSRRAMEARAAEREPHVIISITTPGALDGLAKFRVNRFTHGVLRLEFADLDQPVGGMTEEQLFSDEQAKTIFNFVSRHVKGGVKNIAVHCDGGLSRSPGVAAALAVILKGTGEDAEFFRTKRPNMRVYRKILNAAGLGF